MNLPPALEKEFDEKFGDVEHLGIPLRVNSTGFAMKAWAAHVYTQAVEDVIGAIPDNAARMDLLKQQLREKFLNNQ